MPNFSTAPGEPGHLKAVGSQADLDDLLDHLEQAPVRSVVVGRLIAELRDTLNRGPLDRFDEVGEDQVKEGVTEQGGPAPMGFFLALDRLGEQTARFTFDRPVGILDAPWLDLRLGRATWRSLESPSHVEVTVARR